MTGNSYNKSMGKLKNQAGQVLLITVMLLATVLTVVFAVSFKSTTDSQAAKLEEESQKALAAAQAGIEEAIKSGNIQTAQFSSLVPGFTGSATYSTNASSTFVTPLLQQDEIYTLYLSPPGGTTDQPDFTSFGSPAYSGTIDVCFGTAAGTIPALEFTFLRTDGTVKKYLVNSSSVTIPNASKTADGSLGSCPNGPAFTQHVQLSAAEVGSNKLLVIRAVGSNASTKIGLSGASVFPLQGKTITSTATSSTGVTKKVELFQSYPQIPSEFFVSSL